MTGTEFGTSKKDEGSARPNVFTYESYRLFLKDWLEYLKRRDANFSIRELARQADISHGYIPMIINSTQAISQKTLAKVLPHMALTPGEQSCIRYLCTIEDSENQTEKAEALSKLQGLKIFQESCFEEAQTYRYLSQWYHVAIREMAGMQGFSLDPKWIQKNLKKKVPIADIRIGVEFLLETGYLKKNANGSIEAPERRIHGKGELFKTALAQHHSQMFQIASESIDSTVKDKRSLRSHTVAINREQFEQCKKILEKALEEIAAVGLKVSRAQAVYHFSLLGFPLTEERKEDS